MLLLTVSVSANLSGRDILLRLLSVLLLIALNAFFVTAEFSMVSVRRSRINQLVEAGDVQARTVQSLQRSIERLLSTTQIGITLSSLALGWIAESTIANVMATAIAELPLPGKLSQVLAHSLSIPLTFFLIAYLQIVLGELCPKSVALLYSEQLARFLGPPSLVIARVFNPFIWILNQSTRWLLRLAGIQYTGQGWYNRVTSEELQLIITTERESTGLEAKEREILNNVFEFGEVLAAEVMVPRTSIVSLPSTATFQTMLEEIAKTGHSRYPVTGESLDDILGIIYLKELAEPLSQGQLALDTPIGSWIRPARFVPEFTPLNQLLPLMQRSHLAMVILVDEFGGTVGLVTLKDMIAKIIGDDPRTESEQELAVRILDDRTFLVQAQMDLETVNELLDLNLPLLDEYQTLGGFLIYQYQKIPVQGETLHYDNLELTVISAQGPRLDEIRIHRQEPTAVKLEDISVLGIASIMSTPRNASTDDVTNDIDEDSLKDQKNGF
ncbi:MAG TPA: hemolysin family protein [Candidatus Sericytochromatia bacterium]|jgi:CBS domain containing-hemolysin-like protein